MLHYHSINNTFRMLNTHILIKQSLLKDVFKTEDIQHGMFDSTDKNMKARLSNISILKAVPLLLLHKEETQTTTMPPLGFGKALLALSAS